MNIPKLLKKRHLSGIFALVVLVVFASQAALLPQFIPTLAEEGHNPEVILTIPNDGATGVALDTNVTVVFDENMNGPMISPDPFTIVGSSSGTHTYTYSLVGSGYDTFIIDPDADFVMGETVTVTVHAGIQDSEGEPLENDHVFTFTAVSDITAPNPPTALSATGGDGFVDLNWTLSSSTDVVGQTVYRSTTSGSGYASIARVSGVTTIYYDDTVTNGTPYYYVLTARDSAGNESVYSNEATATPSQADTSPPYVQNLNPVPGATDVSVSTNIYLEVVDTGSGVDQNTINFQVAGTDIVINGIVQSGYTVAINSVTDGYSLDYNPTTDFSEFQVVDVIISASDMAAPANAMSPYSYNFTTEDVTAPTVDNRNPADLSIDVPINSNVVFEIHDAGSGVDLSTVQVDVSGTVYQQGISGFSYVTISDGYRVTINPASNFPYGTVIPVAIDASDNEGNLMPTDNYSFTTASAADTDAPYTTNHNPAPDQVDVTQNTNIYVEILDDGTGVNQNTIDLVAEGVDIVINGVDQTGGDVTITAIANGFSVDYNPATDFSEYQTVDVTVRADDLAPTPNSMSYSYWFRTTDTTPPYTSGHNPADFDTGVLVDSDVVVHVQDDGVGVNILTVSVNVNGTVYGYGNPGFSYAGTTADYTITINPASDFAYGAIIPVTVDAMDGLGNVMPTDSYSFTTEPGLDINAPYLTNHNPAPGETDVAVNTNIYFEILDPGSGVDLPTLDVTVEGVLIVDNGVDVTGGDVTITAIANGFSVDYNPTTDFSEYQIIDVAVSADDLAATPNTLIDSYWFRTADVIPPYTTGHNPADLDTGVLVDSDVVFHVQDDGVGVNLLTVNAVVDGITYANGIPGFSYTGTAADYTITIDPASNFAYGSTISVTLYATDLAGNVMTPYTYSFDTETAVDVIPPYVQNENPLPSATNVLRNTNIYFEVIDDDSGADLSTIDASVEGALIVDNGVTQPGFAVTVTPIANGYSFDYNPTTDFAYDQIVNISIDASDLAVPANVMSTYNYSFTIESATPDTLPPVVQNTIPAPGDSNVAVSTNVYLEVVDTGNGIDLTTVDLTVDGNLIVDNGVVQPGYTVTVTVIANGYSFDYDPTVDFPTDYTVNISVDASDLAVPANAMTTYNYSFDTLDTIPPQMDPLNPSDPDDLATDVPVDSNVTFNFNEEMDNTTLDASSVIVTGSVSGTISGAFSYASVIFNPDTNFVPGETITASVLAAATDLAGNSLDGNGNGISEGSPVDDYTITFTVEAASSDTTPPAAPVVTSPADGSVISDTTPLVYGTAEAGSDVSIYIDSQLIMVVAADADGNFIYSLEQALTNGEHSVYAYAIDAALNQSERSNVNNFIVDTGIVLGATDSLVDAGGRQWALIVFLAALAMASLVTIRFAHAKLNK